MSKVLNKILILTCIVGLHYTQLSAQKFSTAGFYAVENSARKVYNFNRGWRFFKGDVQGADQVGFDDTKWEAANLPHGLEILPENASGGRNYQGIAWYRKQFNVPEKSGRTIVYFEAVMGKCKVFVNGSLVAEHFGGYLPFASDITDALQHDGKDLIAIMADNSNDPSFPPGGPQGGLDLTYFGGIYRDAYIIQTSDIHVTLPQLSKTIAGGGVFAATLDVNDKTAKMVVRTEVKNHNLKVQNFSVKTTLEDANLKTLHTFTQKVKISGETTKQLEKTFTVKDVNFWHPDTPNLHYLKTELIVNGEVVDALRTRIGIRLFEMRGEDGFYINKKPYTEKLMGVNRHQDYVYVGNALPNSGQWRDVKLLREGGSRIIRVAHYPCDPAFYDACDELGMLTTSANPGWHFFNKKNPLFEQRMYEDTRNLVRMSRNNPSVLFWETALNETRSTPEHANHNMHTYAHEEYPFPGMFTATDYQEAVHAGFDVYYNFDDGKVNSFKREFGDGGEVDNWFSQNAETRIKMEWGEKPMLNHALKQAEVLNSFYNDKRIQLGGTKWAGIDHQRGYHPDPFWGGLLNLYRMPKYLYYVYKSQYDANYKVPGIKTGPMLFIANELSQISPSDVVIFSNCDEIKITWLNNEPITQKPSTDPKYSNLPHPPFIFENVFDFSVIKSKYRNKIPEVKMIIEGFLDGELVLKEVKDYAEQTVGLKLSVADEGMNLRADGADFIPVRASTVDGNGNKKVLSSEYVHFMVEGPAEIIGGNATYANPVKTEFGVATVLIRATGEAGEIKVIAHANGIKSDEITFSSVAPTMNMLFDKTFEKASVKPSTKGSVIIQKDRGEMPMDVLELQKEIKQLRLDVVGKEQEIMELRSRETIN